MKKQWETSNRFEDFREESFNFPKSSGDQDVKNHLGKSDTRNEISKKNQSGKHIEQTFLTGLKPTTWNEFQRRTYSFETAMNEGAKETFFPKKEADQKKKGFDCNNLKWSELSSAQCVAQEKQMTKKLREIREIIQEIQKTSQQILKERQKNNLSSTGRATQNWPSNIPNKIVPDTKKDAGSTTFSSSIRRQPQAQIPHFEANSLFKRKLVPIRFTSSFTVDMGSPGKTFTEEVTFQKRLVPTATKGSS